MLKKYTVVKMEFSGMFKTKLATFLNSSMVVFVISMVIYFELENRLNF